jgi:hypothetical protein
MQPLHTSNGIHSNVGKRCTNVPIAQEHPWHSHTRTHILLFRQHTFIMFTFIDTNIFMLCPLPQFASNTLTSAQLHNHTTKRF